MFFHFLDFWYRLIYNGVNYELANECLPTNSCGTQAPVWMIGNYPDQGNIPFSYIYLCYFLSHLNDYIYTVGNHFVHVTLQLGLQSVIACVPTMVLVTKRVSVNVTPFGLTDRRRLTFSCVRMGTAETSTFTGSTRYLHAILDFA